MKHITTLIARIRAEQVDVMSGKIICHGSCMEGSEVGDGRKMGRQE